MTNVAHDTSNTTTSEITYAITKNMLDKTKRTLRELRGAGV